MHHQDKIVPLATRQTMKAISVFHKLALCNYGCLCTYHWLSRGLTPWTPPGNPREHAGNCTFLTIFWARGVGTLFSFGNEGFRPQGCTPGIWSSLVSGTWHVKMGMTELRNSHCVSIVLIKAFSVLLLQVCLSAIFLLYKRFFPR